MPAHIDNKEKLLNQTDTWSKYINNGLKTFINNFKTKPTIKWQQYLNTITKIQKMYITIDTKLLAMLHFFNKNYQKAIELFEESNFKELEYWKAIVYTNKNIEAQLKAYNQLTNFDSTNEMQYLNTIVNIYENNISILDNKDISKEIINIIAYASIKLYKTEYASDLWSSKQGTFLNEIEAYLKNNNTSKHYFTMAKSYIYSLIYSGKYQQIFDYILPKSDEQTITYNNIEKHITSTTKIFNLIMNNVKPVHTERIYLDNFAHFIKEVSKQTKTVAPLLVHYYTIAFHNNKYEIVNSLFQKDTNNNYFNINKLNLSDNAIEKIKANVTKKILDSNSNTNWRVNTTSLQPNTEEHKQFSNLLVLRKEILNFITTTKLLDQYTKCRYIEKIGFLAEVESYYQNLIKTFDNNNHKQYKMFAEIRLLHNNYYVNKQKYQKADLIEEEMENLLETTKEKLLQLVENINSIKQLEADSSIAKELTKYNIKNLSVQEKAKPYLFTLNNLRYTIYQNTKTVKIKQPSTGLFLVVSAQDNKLNSYGNLTVNKSTSKISLSNLAINITLENNYLMLHTENLKNILLA